MKYFRIQLFQSFIKKDSSLTNIWEIWRVEGGRRFFYESLKQLNTKFSLSAFLFNTPAFTRQVYLLKILSEHVKQENCSFYE